MKLKELVETKQFSNAIVQLDQVLKKKWFESILWTRGDDINIRISEIPKDKGITFDTMSKK